MAKRRWHGHRTHGPQPLTSVVVPGVVRPPVVEVVPDRKTDATDMFLRRAMDSVLRMALASTVACTAGCVSAVVDDTERESGQGPESGDPVGTGDARGEGDDAIDARVDPMEGDDNGDERDVPEESASSEQLPGMEAPDGGSNTDMGWDIEGFAALRCQDGSSFPDLSRGLSPENPVDYISINAASPIDESPVVFNAYGDACSTASDASACEAAVIDTSGLAPGNCSGSVPSGDCRARYLVSQQADMVLRWDTREKIIEFLGGVDTPDEAVLLAWYAGYRVECENLMDSAVRAVNDGFEVIAIRFYDCTPAPRFLLHVASDGLITELDSVMFEGPVSCAGRRPQGMLGPSCGKVRGALAGFLANTAYLERAAVEAFVRMADELRAHGAPARLVDRALEAAEDERRHARMVSRLAIRHGAEVPSVETLPVTERSLEAMALENVTEGCVRETYGALVGAFQAREAGDTEIAEVMASIAPDELRHASLSWQVHAWLQRRLDPQARARVEAARADAVSELRCELGQAVDPELTRAAGMPGAVQARALLERLQTELAQEAVALPLN